MKGRREFLASGVAAAAYLVVPGLLEGSPRWRSAGEVVIHKNPGCMCCNRWAEHLHDSGFTTRIEERSDLAAFKDEMQVPPDLRSCHTGLIGDYVVEGHVPAEDISRLLAEGPSVLGIAVAGMPVGSPGMESGDRVDAYEVIAFGQGDEQYVFASHGG